MSDMQTLVTSNTDVASQRSYSTPQLVSFGAVRDLTAGGSAGPREFTGGGQDPARVRV